MQTVVARCAAARARAYSTPGCELKANPKRVLKVLSDGAAAAHAIADPTIREVRRAMGLGREASGL